jgi:hypothetical protein
LRDPAQVGIEIPVDGYDAEPWNGITDYCLYRPTVRFSLSSKQRSRFVILTLLVNRPGIT